MTRTVRIGCFNVDSVTIGSIVQVGDSAHISPYSDIVAVQREVPRYRGNEGNLEQFPLFTQPFPIVNMNESVRLKSGPYQQTTVVHCIRIFGLSASAVVQFGNACTICAGSRTKHIRQLLPPARLVEGNYQSSGS